MGVLLARPREMRGHRAAPQGRGRGALQVAGHPAVGEPLFAAQAIGRFRVGGGDRDAQVRRDRLVERADDQPARALLADAVVAAIVRQEAGVIVDEDGDVGIPGERFAQRGRS